MRTTRLCGPGVALLLALSSCARSFESEAELGEALFHDPSLSLNRTQSCATCHNPERAFIDDRVDEYGEIAATSLGDDGASFGDRNAPTAAYAMFSPPFEHGTRPRHHRQRQHRVYEGYIGGLFHDGRASDLEGQAGGPPLNPIEMAMPDRATVSDRLLENDDYVRGLRRFYGPDVLRDPDAIYEAMARSLAAYERGPTFVAFDSRYDRALRGEVSPSFLELTGKAVFFSQFANCAICHQLYSEGDPTRERWETFTTYEYHNIGVPVNEAAREKNGSTDVDPGLYGHPEVTDEAERGKFKVPTLRNVAVTGPYMHNGVFRELRTVIEFYDRHVNEERAFNPETGLPWRSPEVPGTVADELLRVGDPLTDIEIDGLICFLRSLTDARYEHLIDEDGLACLD